MLLTYLFFIFILPMVLSKQKSFANPEDKYSVKSRRDKAKKTVTITFHKMIENPIKYENNDIKENITSELDETANKKHYDRQWLFIILGSTSLLFLVITVSCLILYCRYVIKCKDKNNNNMVMCDYVKCLRKKRNETKRNPNALIERYKDKYNKEKKRNDCVSLFSIKSDDETDSTEEEIIIFDIDNIP